MPAPFSSLPRSAPLSGAFIVHCFRGDPPRPGFLRPPRSGPSALASWPEDPAADPALSLEVTLYQAALAVSHGGHRQ